MTFFKTWIILYYFWLIYMNLKRTVVWNSRPPFYHVLSVSQFTNFLCESLCQCTQRPSTVGQSIHTHATVCRRTRNSPWWSSFDLTAGNCCRKVNHSRWMEEEHRCPWCRMHHVQVIASLLQTLLASCTEWGGWKCWEKEARGGGVNRFSSKTGKP